MAEHDASIFDYRAVGDVLRERFGGSPFPFERDAAPVGCWYCDHPGCTYWRDEMYEYRGRCNGACGGDW
jgi:hypothetical protein